METKYSYRNIYVATLILQNTKYWIQNVVDSTVPYRTYTNTGGNRTVQYNKICLKFREFYSSRIPTHLFLRLIISSFKLLAKHFNINESFALVLAVRLQCARRDWSNDDTSVAAPQCCRTLRHTIVPSSITQLHIEKCRGNSTSSSSSFLVIVFCV